MLLPAVLVLLAVLFRIAPTLDLSLSNLAPFTAIAFCGAVYVRQPWFWALSFLALEASDVYVNWFHARAFGYHWDTGGFVLRSLCFFGALGLGHWVSTRKSWLGLLNGSLLGALLFYLVTNTQSWWADPFYAKTLAGWWQALTLGHPEFPPTIYFFRNTLFGDLMFTGLFAGLMEIVARRQSEPSLLDEEEGEAAEEETAEAEAEAKE